MPPSLDIVIADIPGTVDAKPDTVESKAAVNRVPAKMLTVVAYIVGVGKEHH